MGLREDRLGRISTHWRTCGCTRGDSAETCGMSRSGFCSTSPVEWNHLQAPLQAHRANRWSSEYQRRTWRAGVGVGHRAASPACPPAPGQEKVRGSSASAWAGDRPHAPPCHSCLSWELQPGVRESCVPWALHTEEYQRGWGMERKVPSPEA